MSYWLQWVLFVAMVLGLVWLACMMLALPVLLVWAVRRRQYSGGEPWATSNYTPSRPPGLRRPPILPRRQQRHHRPLVATPHQMRAAVKEISIYTHDEETAARLLHHTRIENRGKPLSWCVEKTIHDLVRDRR